MSKVSLSTISNFYEKQYETFIKKGLSNIETIKLINDAILVPHSYNNSKTGLGSLQGERILKSVILSTVSSDDSVKDAKLLWLISYSSLDKICDITVFRNWTKVIQDCDSWQKKDKWYEPQDGIIFLFGRVSRLKIKEIIDKLDFIKIKKKMSVLWKKNVKKMRR